MNPGTKLGVAGTMTVISGTGLVGGLGVLLGSKGLLILAGVLGTGGMALVLVGGGILAAQAVRAAKPGMN